MIPLPIPWSAVAAIALAATSFAGGYALKGRLDAAAIERLRGDIARIEAAHAEEKRQAAEAARARLEAAQAKADAAVAAQSRLETRLKEEQARVKAALYRLPSRPCLDGAHLGLLARSPGIRLVPVPQAAGGTPGPAAGAPADPGPAPAAGLAATDTAVTGWMIDAAALYETCRGRIEALRQWAEQTD